MSTADFLFELGTEELPPNALLTLIKSLEQQVFSALELQQLQFNRSASRYFATPRRLALYIADLQQQQSDSTERKLGPAVSAAFDDQGKPSKAAQGFARGLGVSVDDLGREVTDKGERLCFEKRVEGQPAASLLPGIIEEALAKLPIPKRMRWSDSRVEFVRPVHWLTMMMGSDTIDASIMGLRAENLTYGHRFHAPDAIKLKHASDYEQALSEQGSVVADIDKRRAQIEEQVNVLAKQHQGNAVIDSSLLDEVTALVEQPVALSGEFDASFLSVPQEALIYSMSEHQKYFHMVDANGKLMPRFITVSNITSLAPEKIISGNERVIRPRLADAAFFFDTDKKTTLATKRDKLRDIVFQKSLGTVYDKTERLANLAAQIATTIGGDSELARQAAQLSKADLVSDMVLEFDKMQGVAGRYYALHDGLSAVVANAIEEHYLPRYAGDKLPTDATSSAVALADRLDTLTGIFGIGQEPSGSKDPFALRRACIGILNILINKDYAIDIHALLRTAAQQHKVIDDPEAVATRVQSYLFDRFATMYQEQGIATEIFLAVRAKQINNPVDFNARINAVADFNASDSAASLSAANKRVSNILEKSASNLNDGTIDPALFDSTEEEALYQALNRSENAVTPLFDAGDYSQGLSQLTSLREPVDAFFDKVMVNVDDEAVKNNRLRLLARLRTLFLNVADISLLAGTR